MREQSIKCVFCSDMLSEMHLHELVMLVIKENPKGKNRKQIAVEFGVDESTVARWTFSAKNKGIRICVDDLIRLKHYTGDLRIKRWVDERLQERG